MKRLITLAAGLFITCSALAQESGNVQVTNLRIIPGPTEQAGYVEGIATNTTNKVLNMVIVEFNLYDTQNNQVGNTLAVAQNLAPGGTWKFQAPTARPFDHASLTKVTAN